MHLFLSLALAVSQAVAQPQATRQQNQQAPATQQRGTDSLPVAVKLLNTGKTAQEASEESRQAAEASEINRRQLRTNYILAGLAGLAAVLSWWTFHQTRKITRQQLRAYVMVESITPTQHVGLPSFPMACHYSVVVKNFGQTPAYALTVEYGYAINALNEEEASPDLVLNNPVKRPGSRGALGPGGSVSIHAGYDTLSPEIKSALYANTVRVYIYGTLTYRDAFGHKHATHFRFRRDDGGHGMTAGNEGNNSD